MNYDIIQSLFYDRHNISGVTRALFFIFNLL